MHKHLLCLVFFCCVVFHPQQLTAGVYNTAERPLDLSSPIPGDFAAFREQLLVYWRVSNPDLDSALRNRAELVASLAPRRADPLMEIQNKIDLGAYLIRLGQYGKAVDMLQPGSSRHPLAFLVYANRGTALQKNGELEVAGRYLSTGYGQWPRKWADLSEDQQKLFRNIGWNERQFEWYRQVEKYQITLVVRRQAETRRPDAMNQFGVPKYVDALFHKGGQPLRFENDKGEYVIGTIAEGDKDKLPPGGINEAIRVVQQLLLWLPDDDRLYWQLGELLNARGDKDLQDTRNAVAIFDYLIESKKARFGNIIEHRQMLADYNRKTTSQENENQKDKDTKTTPETTPLIDPYRAFAVGFAAGIVLAVFGYWQFREWSRRIQKRRTT